MTSPRLFIPRILTAIFLAGLTNALPGAAPETPRRPNIVFIVAY